jgi:adenylate kinase family enzyme
MPRVSVIGSSGSGKTTLAGELARRLGVPHFELDSFYHQPGWVPLDRESFQKCAAELAATDAWVIDGNYNSHGVTQIVWARADTIVWLDPPRRVVMTRVVARSLRRVLLGEVLWNGNRESVRNLFDHRPEQNVALWAFTRFHTVRKRYAQMMHDGTWAGHSVHRLCSPTAVERFLTEQAQTRG